MKALINQVIITPIYPERVFRRGDMVLDASITAMVHEERYYPTSGIVIDACSYLSGDQKCTHDIRPGDTVYFHYNATDVGTYINKDTCVIGFDLVYAWQRGEEIFMAQEWCFIEPVEEEKQITASGLLIVKNANVIRNEKGELDLVPDTKSLEGIVRHLPKHSTESFINEGEVNIGDRVKMETTSDVKFTLEGKEYYRTRYSEILCVV